MFVKLTATTMGVQMRVKAKAVVRGGVKYDSKLERDVFKRANPATIRRLAELLKLDEKQLWVGE